MTPGRAATARQDWATPSEFLDAVEARFGTLAIDLAARADNAVAPLWLDEAVDSLTVDWAGLPGRRWLNPPFRHIAPWIAKAAELEHDTHETIVLVPASVGANWFADYVLDRARVVFVRPRLTFVGASDPYPRDLMLAVYGRGVRRGVEAWRWR